MERSYKKYIKTVSFDKVLFIILFIYLFTNLPVAGIQTIGKIVPF